MPTFFELFMGALSVFYKIKKGESEMKETIMKAVGAVAAGRNRKFTLETVGVTIYCDEGSWVQIPPRH